jgi:putative exosortase-associated protein (TIGR04073 family)
MNTITSPLELPAQMYVSAKYREETSDSPFKIFGGFIEGIPRGLVYFPWRFTAGIYDIVTFPFSSRNQCIISPEYVSFSTRDFEKH